MNNLGCRYQHTSEAMEHHSILPLALLTIKEDMLVKTATLIVCRTWKKHIGTTDAFHRCILVSRRIVLAYDSPSQELTDCEGGEIMKAPTIRSVRPLQITAKHVSAVHDMELISREISACVGIPDALHASTKSCIKNLKSLAKRLLSLIYTLLIACDDNQDLSLKRKTK